MVHDGCGCQVVECAANRAFMQSKEFIGEMMIARVRVALGGLSEDWIFGGGKVVYAQAPRIVTRSRATLAPTSSAYERCSRRWLSELCSCPPHQQNAARATPAHLD